MANLLLRKQKRFIQREYQFRVLTVFFGMSAAFLLASVLLLLPSYVLSSGKEDIVRSRIDGEKNKTLDLVTPEERADIVKGINARADALSSVTRSSVSSTGVVGELAAMRPAGIRITGIHFSAADAEGKLSVSGVARNRAALASFVEILEGHELFSDVDLPISSFVADRDISFSVKMSVRK